MTMKSFLTWRTFDFIVHWKRMGNKYRGNCSLYMYKYMCTVYIYTYIYQLNSMYEMDGASQKVREQELKSRHKWRT